MISRHPTNKAERLINAQKKKRAEDSAAQKQTNPVWKRKRQEVQLQEAENDLREYTELGDPHVPGSYQG